jgi:hypothetical protein
MGAVAVVICLPDRMMSARWGLRETRDTCQRLNGQDHRQKPACEDFDQVTHGR